jgi:hypothetical protein
MMIDKENCPKCNKTVWIDYGSTEDLTAEDRYTFECVHCLHIFTIGEPEDLPNDPEPIIWPTYKTPNQAGGIC